MHASIKTINTVYSTFLLISGSLRHLAESRNSGAGSPHSTPVEKAETGYCCGTSPSTHTLRIFGICTDTVYESGAENTPSIPTSPSSDWLFELPTSHEVASNSRGYHLAHLSNLTSSDGPNETCTDHLNMGSQHLVRLARLWDAVVMKAPETWLDVPAGLSPSRMHLPSSPVNPVANHDATYTTSTAHRHVKYLTVILIHKDQSEGSTGLGTVGLLSDRPIFKFFPDSVNLTPAATARDARRRINREATHLTCTAHPQDGSCLLLVLPALQIHLKLPSFAFCGATKLTNNSTAAACALVQARTQTHSIS